MARKLNESSAVIVGGTSGIGFAAAKTLLKSGLQKLTICARDVTKGRNALSKLAAEFPGAYLHFVQCDASDPHRTETAITHAELAMGRIDILVSSGSIGALPRPLEEVKMQDLMPSITALMSSILHPVRAVMPVMTKQRCGSIICLTSDVAFNPTYGSTVIGAGSAGIVMFCRTLAEEAKLSCIRVNCVSPSIVHGTSLYERLKKDPFASDIISKVEKNAQLGEIMPDEVAEAICFLAGPNSAKITGQTINVSGGSSTV
ncbi:SDR family oxidoreductase [Pseudovibrio sp. Tun.PSC04-5.I4]|uniref:SDR family NAD(P)-dependent oxidoreductase n=1 Tax=Pseudovibrio sp. Tun.PSC04-5.I4 TaxID=1798213 RepID=UPI000886DD59|nr:SDR family oxidoreductase [Pseudovibrio sp. Tun.PSC04-5.I4]SDQ24114.1 gluconate 5-dehydrogenase [Pseudovibrio sp. Tun.PSC04-5.I4]